MSTHTLATRLPLRHAPAAVSSAATHGEDSTLRQRVLVRLRQQPWWDADTTNVYVEQGTVVLQGLVRDAAARRAGRRIAAAVPGVQQVWDARVRPRD